MNGLRNEDAVLVLGVGNTLRRDDGVGLLAADALRKLLPPGFSISESDGRTDTLLDLFQKSGRVVLVDAAAPTGHPGRISRFDVRENQLPADTFPVSTHLGGPREAIELARSLDLLPPVLVVYGIEGTDFSLGEGLSETLQLAFPAIIRELHHRILSELTG